MSQKHNRCYNQAQQWITWLNTRRFFAQPPQRNILLLLQGIRDQSRGEPDGIMSAELCAFNLCVKAQEDDYLIPFLFVYCGAGDKPAKCYASDLDLSLPSFYERAHKAATDIYRSHIKLIDMHNKMQSELSGYV